WEIRTASGEAITARAVVFACHILTTLDLLGRNDSTRSRLRLGNGMGMVLRVLTDRLPTYRTDVDGITNGMQFPEPSRDQLRSAYGDYLRGMSPTDLPLLVLTPTATDDTLAPAGRHVVTIWTQWHPRHLRGETWDGVREPETRRLVDALDRHAPGFAQSVHDTFLQTPADLEAE